jgi:hypothetical protein
MAQWVAATLIGGGSVAAALLVLDGNVQAVLAVGVALFVGIVTYTSIFTWVGLVTTCALAYGLVYFFLREGLTSSYFGGIRYLSVRG